MSVDANPLTDISNTQKIWGVVSNGRYVDAAMRQAMLDKVEALFRAPPLPPGNPE